MPKGHKNDCKCCICKAKRHENKGKDNPFYGKKHTKKTKEKMSMNHYNCSGDNNPFYGRHHSNETKRKISNTKMGKPTSHHDDCTCLWCDSRNGKNNPFYGKRHTEIVKKKISAFQQGIDINDWNGYKSFELYGVEFNNELKEMIRMRDKHICQECGIHQDELDYELSVHHIDYDKQNNSMKNLISLCKSCHGKTIFDRNNCIDYYKNKMEMKYG